MNHAIYNINKSVNQPIEFRGLQAQYIGYLGIGCVGLLIGFAVMYLLGVNPYICIVSVLGVGVFLINFIIRLSHRYGEFGLMKRMALSRIPKTVTTHTIDARLPIMGVEHDCLLSKQGDITLAFALTLPEIFTLSAQEYEALHQAWVKAIKVLPKHSVLHKQDWFRAAGFKPDGSAKAATPGAGAARTQDATTAAAGEKTFLSQSSDRFFLERPYLDHDCYLFLTKKPGGRKLSSSAVSNLFRSGIVPEQTLNPRMLQEFLDSTGQFCRILQETGLIKVERIEERDLLSARGRPGLVERYCFLQSDKNHQVLRDLSLDNELAVGDLLCQLYTLSDAESLPKMCSAYVHYDKYSSDQAKCALSFGASLGQCLPCNHLYNQYIFVEDAQKTIHSLEAKRRRLQSLSAQSRANGIARDGVDSFLDENAREQRLPVKAHFNVLAWSEDPEELKDIRNRVTASLSQLDASLKQETVGAAQIFWAGIPGNAADFPMNDTFDTFAEQAACFLNQETRYRSSFSPVGIRLGDRQTGVPVHVDISDEPIERGYCSNRNKFILGPSGSGKSFFTNHMVRTYYEQGTHIVLVDVGHSYQGLCNLVGGYYFTYSEQHPICFNPFYLDSGVYPDSEKKESIKTLLLALWKKDDETLFRSEYVALSNALQAYYSHLQEHPELFPCFNTFYEFLRDEFADLLRLDRVKDRDFDMDNFLFVLKPYYEGGEFDYLLNARENLDLLGERFIVFELDKIKDHPILFPVVTIIIMEVFINKMRKLKGVRKMILIEEAWKAIAREGMAEYIQYLFKTVRKFYGEAIVVTQEIDDIISSPVVKQAIINNSDCKILLDQSKYQNKFDQVQQLLGLSDKEKTLVLSLNKANEPGRQYKEVFISLGGRLSKVYRTEVSPEEYLTYTTEEKEKVQVMEYAKKFGDMKKGIMALLAVKHLVLIILLAMGVFGPTKHTRAQIPVIGVIQTLTKKVIVALDLEVQRIQTETIELQSAQKAIENDMAQSELGEIGSWQQKEKDLFSEYYTELWQVKEVLTDYQRIKDIAKRQVQLIGEYHQAYALFQQDKHFSASEIQYMSTVYSGILDASARNLDQLYLVVNSFSTQMTDAQRLRKVDEAEEGMNNNYYAFRRFNEQNVMLSLQRTRSEQDLATIKQLYGIP